MRLKSVTIEKGPCVLRRCVLNSRTQSPSGNHCCDLSVRDSAVLPVCFHCSLWRKRIRSVFDPQVWIAKPDGHN